MSGPLRRSPAVHEDVAEVLFDYRSLLFTFDVDTVEFQWFLIFNPVRHTLRHRIPTIVHDSSSQAIDCYIGFFSSLTKVLAK